MLKESCLGQTILYRGEEYEIPLAGVYQKENAVVALNALKVLDELGFPTTLRSRKRRASHSKLERTVYSYLGKNRCLW